MGGGSLPSPSPSLSTGGGKDPPCKETTPPGFFLFFNVFFCKFVLRACLHPLTVFYTPQFQIRWNNPARCSNNVGFLSGEGGRWGFFAECKNISHSTFQFPLLSPLNCIYLRWIIFQFNSILHCHHHHYNNLLYFHSIIKLNQSSNIYDSHDIHVNNNKKNNLKYKWISEQASSHWYLYTPLKGGYRPPPVEWQNPPPPPT